MIHFIRGNLFNSQAQALVNTVNCVGVMGKGIAYQFKRAFPVSSAEYMARCRRHEVRLGEVTGTYESGRWIIQFPTKQHWKSFSQLSDVEAGLRSLRRFLEAHKIRSVAVPPLGCGNGGLAWQDVRGLIVRYLDGVPDLTVEVYEPIAETAELKSEIARKPRLSLSAVVIAAIRLRLEATNKLTLQKALYFFDVFAGHQYFRFIPHRFGPWCPDVDRLALLLRDYLDFTNLDLGSLIDQALRHELSGDDAERFQRWIPAIEAAAKLVNDERGQIEAVATVHAILRRSAPHALSEPEVVQSFFAWSEQKAEKFGERDVSCALNSLARHGLARASLLGWELPGRPR